jgi:hypothetical protein
VVPSVPKPVVSGASSTAVGLRVQVMRYIREGVSDGATVLCGGGRSPRHEKGYAPCLQSLLCCMAVGAPPVIPVSSTGTTCCPPFSRT